MYLHLLPGPASRPSPAAAVPEPRGLLLLGVAAGEVQLSLRRRRMRLDVDACCAVPADEDIVLRADSGGVPLSVFVDAAECVEAGADALLVGHLLPVDDALRSAWRRATADAAGRVERVELAQAVAGAAATLRGRAEAFACVRAATRDSQLERILCATDFIAGHFDEPIGLEQMAGAASLSRFHFVRLFRALHGETPHAYLVRKRAAVARRRLACGDDLAEAASRAGFGSRSALFRSLRKTTPAVAAAAAAAATPCSPSA